MILPFLALSVLVQTALGQPIDPVATLVSLLPVLQSHGLSSLARMARGIIALASVPLAATFVAYCKWKLSRLGGGHDQHHDQHGGGHAYRRHFAKNRKHQQMDLQDDPGAARRDLLHTPDHPRRGRPLCACARPRRPLTVCGPSDGLQRVPAVPERAAWPTCS